MTIEAPTQLAPQPFSQPLTPPIPAAPTLPNPWLRRLAWLAAGIAAMWALTWLAVPPLLKSQVEKIASEKLGRQVSIGQVDFKPWSLELTVADLKIATQDGNAPQLAIGRIYIDAELQSLLRLAPVVDAIQVDAPQLWVTHLGGGKYDVDDLIARFATPEKPQEANASPVKFALYNIALNAGTVDFTDRAVGKTHTLRNLLVSVPFLSNLDSQRQVSTAPRLAFNLNGSQFDSAATSLPFAQTHQTDATLKIAALDLAPYLGYLPAALPVKLQSAVLSADLRLAFAQNPQPVVQLSGSVAANNVQMQDARGADLLRWDALTLSLKDLQPLAQQVHLSKVELSALTLNATRDKAGQLNLALLAAVPGAQVATDSVAARAIPSKSKPLKDIKNSAANASAWKLQLDQVDLRGATVLWSDASTSPQASAALKDVQVQVHSVVWPFAADQPRPMGFAGSAVLQGASLTFTGTATDQTASVTASVGGLPLDVAAPYLAQFITPQLRGVANAQLGLQWAAPGDVVLDVRQLGFTQLALLPASASASVAKSPSAASALASIQKLDISNARIDLAGQSVRIGKIQLQTPRALVERGADQRWMFENWLKTAPSAATAQATATSAHSPAKPWKFAMDDIAVDAGQISFSDRAMAKPVALELSAIKARLGGYALDAKKPMALAVSTQLAQRPGNAASPLAANPGRVDYRGTVGLLPVSVQGALNLQRIPVHALEPYFADALNIELLRADTSFKGQVTLAMAAQGLALQLSGDTSVEDFLANQRSAHTGQSDELLSWKALGVRGLVLDMAPGTATRVNVQETTLADFFARILVNPQGRINLQDIVKSTPAAGTLTTTATLDATETVAARAISTSTAAIKPIETKSPEAVISIGQISLIHGKVFFSDQFIKPNYSANLSELTGKLGAFSSQPVAGTVQLADLELRGKAEGTASLEIVGKLNPLAQPLALDITGKVRDLELPPLSPYSVKYAGYGIERGKLSVDVRYLVKPDGQLTASNNIVLNQLRFGDKVEGAPNSLPVKLAVALLADRNGVIDINLPVSGSLNDPQFSIGGIVFKLIINLVVKAITSPFSLLASAMGGGGDELSSVAFAPGSAVVSAESGAQLRKVVKALQERPALKMTVMGTSNLDAEREGYKQQRLQALLQAEKRRSAVVSGGTSSAVVSVSADEMPQLLKAIYQRTDMPKQRNAIGLQKDLPVADMQALLLAHIPVSPEAMNELAVQRGVAVRDYIASQGLGSDRLFLGAAKTVPPDAKWTPRAELSLAAQ